jgi:hypothetical protein
VSTSPDQIAIAPGYLQREWTENGRRYFHYKMDSPILGFWAYLSARYAVKRDRWNDVDIEIYYHEPHHFNVDRMIESVKKSLDYFTENFGPYQHRQVRIIEFPRFTPDELLELVRRRTAELQIELPAEVATLVAAHLTQVHDGGRFRTARYVPSLVEEMYARMAARALADGVVTPEERRAFAVGDVPPVAEAALADTGLRVGFSARS